MSAHNKIHFYMVLVRTSPTRRQRTGATGRSITWTLDLTQWTVD